MASLILLFISHEAWDEKEQHGKTLEVKGCPSGLWDLFVVFSSNAFMYVVKFPPPYKLPILPTFIQVVGRFIGLGLLKCHEGPLVCEQTSFPISRGCVGFISTQSSMVYLRNWALLALIIASSFFHDYHSFLLEVIGACNLGMLPFQTHLRMAQYFLPL